MSPSTKSSILEKNLRDCTLHNYANIFKKKKKAKMTIC